MNIDELRSKVAELRDEIETLSTTEDITPEQDERLDAALDEIEARTAELAKAEERAAKIEQVRSVTVERTPGVPQFMRRTETDVDYRTAAPQELRSAALKTVEADREAGLSPEQQEQVEKLLRSSNGNTDGLAIAKRLLITERAEYKSGFVKAMFGYNGYTPEEARALDEFRAAALSPTSAGGFGVPVLIDPTIILTSQGSSNAVYNAARKVTITTDKWNGVTSAGANWSWDGEAVQVSDDAPTLAQPSVTAHKAAGFIPYSIEIGQDYPDFAGEMSRLLAEGYSELLAQALVVGSGSGQPKGIAVALNATASEVLPTTDGAFGAVDVYALWDALPERFRTNAKWLSSTATMNSVRRFATGSSNSDANFTVNITQESVPQLFGREYMTSEYMADFTGTTGQSDYLIIGDFNHFLVAQRAGMSVELVPHIFSTNAGRPTGQRGWYAWARVGSDAIVTNAFRMLANT